LVTVHAKELLLEGSKAKAVLANLVLELGSLVAKVCIGALKSLQPQVVHEVRARVVIITLDRQLIVLRSVADNNHVDRVS
jgi:hypothetical protein